MRFVQYISKTPTDIRKILAFAIYPLPLTYRAFQDFLQFTGLKEVHPVKVNMKYRIFQPFFLQPLYCQVLEKFLVSQEIMFKSAAATALRLGSILWVLQ